MLENCGEIMQKNEENNITRKTITHKKENKQDITKNTKTNEYFLQSKHFKETKRNKTKQKQR